MWHLSCIELCIWQFVLCNGFTSLGSRLVVRSLVLCILASSVRRCVLLAAASSVNLRIVFDQMSFGLKGSSSMMSTL